MKSSDAHSRALWPSALLLLAGTLRSGSSIEDGVRAMVEKTPPPFGNILRRRWSAADAAIPWERRVDRLLPEPELALVRAALSLTREAGGKTAPLIENCVATLQRKEQLALKLKAMTAQNRASAWIVGLSPAALIGLFGFVSPDYVEPLLTTSMGRLVLGLAAVLNTLGLFCVHRMARLEN